MDDLPLLDSRSPAMARLLETAKQAAASDATILLTGESGTGKNVIARQIHRWSLRHDRVFVVVNCTTLSEELLESELFGHVRGAFTGAIKDKPGRLEAADGGTVFLDEIADLSGQLQTKFLRFVQEQSFERVGGDRVIHGRRAHHRGLQSRPRGRGRGAPLPRRSFLSSQCHHACGCPSLRERREDILPLAEWMLKSASIRNRRSPMSLSPEAAAAISKYRWPGNVRELRNSLERAAVLTRGEVIEREDLPDSLFREATEAPSLAGISHSASLEEVEREHIARVLSESATLDEAAATLGINATTLWRKRKRYGIE